MRKVKKAGTHLGTSKVNSLLPQSYGLADFGLDGFMIFAQKMGCSSILTPTGPCRF